MTNLFHHTISKRYHNNTIRQLVSQLNDQSLKNKITMTNRIKKDQKLHYSCSNVISSTSIIQNQFNNKTKNGELFDKNINSIPYIFIPKYKNQTFITPNRVYQKGQLGKRFKMKMKDSSILSFNIKQSKYMQQKLNKNNKDKTIIGRKMEEFNQVLNNQNGSIKAQKYKYYLKHRKIFNPTSTTSEIFSEIEPMIAVKADSSLNKTKNFSKTFSLMNCKSKYKIVKPFSVTTNLMGTRNTSDF